MFYKEHGPPHLHAAYGDHKATFEIESERIHGRLPRHAQALVLEWMRLHRTELLEDWRRARAGQPLVRIPPLE